MLPKTKIIILSLIAAIIIGLVSFAAHWKTKEAKQTKIIETPGQNQPEKQQKTFKSVPVYLADCDKYDKEDEKNACLANNAITAGDKEICNKIIGEEAKNKCLEIFLYNEITKGEDEKKCFDLKAEELKNLCLNDFFWKWNEPEKCAGLEGDNKAKCEDIINNKLAYGTGEAKNCAKINSEILKEDCAETIANKPKDSDSDGIIDSLEISYGTDPFKADTDEDGLPDLDELSKYFTNAKKADTDEDGYSDGDEIKNGFNPKGEGKLQ